MSKNRKIYTVIFPVVISRHAFYLHALGCRDIARELREGGGGSEDITIDLSNEKESMKAIDPDDLGYGMHDVKIHTCAIALDAATPLPTTRRKRNGRAEDEAGAKATTIVKELIKKVTDPYAVGRLATCDDTTYAKAVEIRRQREAGEAWWRIAQAMGLPGAGASAKQGKSGAAFARRIWERAWGKTYGDSERALRETRDVKREATVLAPHRSAFRDGTTDQEIAAAILGNKIYWSARLGTGEHGIVVSPQEAYVHHDPRLVKVKQGPRGRYVEFYEQIDAAHLRIDPHLSISKSGPIRSVYVSQIERVGR